MPLTPQEVTRAFAVLDTCLRKGNAEAVKKWLKATHPTALPLKVFKTAIDTGNADFLRKNLHRASNEDRRVVVSHMITSLTPDLVEVGLRLASTDTPFHQLVLQIVDHPNAEQTLRALLPYLTPNQKLVAAKSLLLSSRPLDIQQRINVVLEDLEDQRIVRAATAARGPLKDILLTAAALNQRRRLAEQLPQALSTGPSTRKI